MTKTPSQHQCIPPASRLNRPGGAAVRLGFAMPAEFEPQQAVWVKPPVNPYTWPGCLDRAQTQFDFFLTELKKSVRIENLDDHQIKAADSWIRDFGPLFVRNATNQLACHDFRFNCWGTGYSPYHDDDLVPQWIALKQNLPIWIHDVVLEGGAIEVNGQGTAMVAASCILDPNRNPGMTRDELATLLHHTLGISHIIWLPSVVLPGDDTGGHVDTFARFINPQTVVVVHPPDNHVDHALLEPLWECLGQATDQAGQRLHRVALPAPGPMFWDYPSDRWEAGGTRRLPASYANFLICNGTVFVPTFGQRTDDSACEILRHAMPRHTVVPIPSQALIVGQGSLHCLTQPQPTGS